MPVVVDADKSDVKPAKVNIFAALGGEGERACVGSSNSVRDAIVVGASLRLTQRKRALFRARRNIKELWSPRAPWRGNRDTLGWLE